MPDRFLSLGACEFVQLLYRLKMIGNLAISASATYIPGKYSFFFLSAYLPGNSVKADEISNAS